VEAAACSQAKATGGVRSTVSPYRIADREVSALNVRDAPAVIVQVRYLCVA
jgi:hypothetical protein